MAEPKPPAPVSCLITAYNAAPYIEEAVQSLVQQTRPPAEIILVDDGSTDDTAARAQEAGGGLLRVIRQENSGVAMGRNRGLKEASQPFVMFADADDISLPNRIAWCLEAFDEVPERDAVFANWRNFWIEALAHEETDGSSRAPSGEQTSRYLCTGMYRADLVRAVGAFDPSLKLCEVQWVSRAIKTATAVGDIGRLTYLRRIHHTNISRTMTLDSTFDLVQRLRGKS